MGSALAEGLLSVSWCDREALAIVEQSLEQRAVLSRRFPDVSVLASLELDHVGPRTGAVLCVKPDHAEGAVRVAAIAGVTRLLSVVAGLSTARLEAAFPGPVAVIRSMANTPALEIGRASCRARV